MATFIAINTAIYKYHEHRNHEAHIQFMASLNPNYPQFTPLLAQYWLEQKENKPHERSLAEITYAFNVEIWSQKRFNGDWDVNRMIGMLTNHQYRGAQGLFNRTIVKKDK